MPDDRDRPRRAKTHADERDRLHRRTPPLGYPVYVPEETTPPPQEPPRPDTIDGYSTIAPPIRAQLDILAEGQSQVVAAMGKLWDLRDGTWRDRIDAKLGSLGESASRQDAILGELRPQLDRWRAATDDLTQQLPKLIGMVEGLTHHVRSIDARMRDLELEVRSLGERSAGQADDIVAEQVERAELTRRLAAVELALRDKSVASTAIAKRDKWWIAGISALVGLAAGSLPTVISFVRNHF